MQAGKRTRVNEVFALTVSEKLIVVDFLPSTISVPQICYPDTSRYCGDTSVWEQQIRTGNDTIANVSTHVRN